MLGWQNTFAWPAPHRVLLMKQLIRYLVQVQDKRIHVPLGSPTAAGVLGITDDTPPPSSVPQQQAESENEATSWQHSIEAGVVAGFQLATSAGPLCDEPLWGVAFQV